MDNSSDEFITFDEKGYCNYCSEAMIRKELEYFPNETGEEKLNLLISKLKNSKSKYDCLMGISGGIDSSYLLYLGYKWGLKVLVLHIDDGYDTEISKSNIKKLIKRTGFDYINIEGDKTQFNSLIRAYMKAGVPNLAAPQDNILKAIIYKTMRKFKIKSYLSGGNFATESILQKGNTHSALDTINIRDINKKFGNSKINKLPLYTTFNRIRDIFSTKINIYRPLNYIEYNNRAALEKLSDFCGFEYYGSKHLENSFTAFLQLYWLPKKFGVDKRKSHLSSLIISKQISREEAIKILSMSAANDTEIINILRIMSESLDLTKDEFEDLLNSEIHDHKDFRTDNIYKILMKIKKIIK
jgi:N-acetyl sugar amidotransferase